MPDRILPGVPQQPNKVHIIPGSSANNIPTIIDPSTDKSPKESFIDPDLLHTKTVTNRFVMSLAQDKSGSVWVGTESEGVWRYDEKAPDAKRWKQFTTKDGLGDDNAYAVACDHQGRIWIGHLDHGVSVYNGQSWKNYDILDGPLGERVYDIAVEPHDGAVWIASSAGLACYSPVKDDWTYYTRGDGLPAEQIAALAFNARGDLFAGTQCEGLAIGRAANHYQTWRIVRGAEKMPNTPLGQGLPSNLINDVLVAKSGAIYVATNCGLARSFDDGVSWDYLRGADWQAKVRGLHNGPTPQALSLPGDLLLEDYSTCLGEDAKGRIYVGHWQRGCELRDVRATRRVDSSIGLLGAEADYVRTVLTNGDHTFLGFYGGGARAIQSVTQDAQGTQGARADGTFQLPIMGNALPARVVLDNANQQINSIESNVAKVEPIIINPLPRSPFGGALPNADTAGVSTAKANSLKDNPVKDNSIKDGAGAPVSLSSPVPLLSSVPLISSVAFPSPARTSVGELKTLLAKVQSSRKAAPTQGAAGAVAATYADEDWTSKGDWVGRYGQQVGVLSGVMSPFDHRFFWNPDYTIEPQIGPHHTDDALRAWLHWRKTDKSDALYDPIIGYRRQAEWDDHGESYSITHEGPDILVAVGLPKGLYRISLYFFNKDGKVGNNRLRDYLVELKPNAPTPEQAYSLPSLARARVRDFAGGGVYKQFVVKGGDRYYIKIARNGSFNTICSGLFIDKLSGPATKYDKLPMAWLGDVQYGPPVYQDFSGETPTEEISTKEISTKEISTEASTSSVRPTSPANVEALQRAEDLWLNVQQFIDCDGMAGLSRLARLKAYRVANKAGATDKLLSNWRWTLCLWTPADRAEFRSVMERAHEAQLKITPEIRGN